MTCFISGKGKINAKKQQQTYKAQRWMLYTVLVK